MKKESCKFAKWLGKHGWYCVSNSGKLWERPHDIKHPKKGVYHMTIDELYDEYNGKK